MPLEQHKAAHVNMDGDGDDGNVNVSCNPEFILQRKVQTPTGLLYDICIA